MHVDVGGAKIFFEVVGTKLVIDGPVMRERPTLIVMHGGPGFDHSMLRMYFDRFADAYQVIYIDHRGNGRSTGEPDTWTLAQWGDDLHAFCQALSIEKPLVYGLSFGGMVAMSYAARHPEHPAKLVFASTAGKMDWEASIDAFEKLGGPNARAIAEGFWTAPTAENTAEYMKVCMPLYNPHGATPPEVRARAIMRTEVMHHFINGEQQHMDLLTGLSAVTCPTLVIGGGLDPITPPSCSKAIFEALPKGVAQLVMFDDAGHGVQRDEPDRAETVFREFWGS